MRINIYNSNDYFLKKDNKWYLVSNGVKSVVTKEDCDIDTLECGQDGNEVYGTAVFGY